MKIGLVGAFDRFNYGDILFPIITQLCIQKKMKNVTFGYYGSRESDLSHFGGVKTKSMAELKCDDVDIIILVGGEILTANWFDTYYYLINNQFSALGVKVLRKVVGYERMEKIARKKLRLTQKLPWIIDNIDYSTSKIIYNAVGGVDVLELPESKLEKLEVSLKRANYISVRDEKTINDLLKLGVSNVRITPDSAFIMSKVFPKDSLHNRVSLATKGIENIKGEYVVFQIGINYAKGGEKLIAQQLSLINEKLGKKIVLLPIGLALAHEDNIPLERVYQYYEEISLNKDSILYVEHPTVLDTMYVISNSAIFIGTSLHGNITALSYGLPSVGIGSLDKIKFTLGTWSVPGQVLGVEFSDIFISVKKSLQINKRTLLNNASKNADLVDQNFELIVNCIKEKK